MPYVETTKATDHKIKGKRAVRHVAAGVTVLVSQDIADKIVELEAGKIVPKPTDDLPPVAPAKK